jgi:N-acetylglucosamine kinase-like BadF-type ATPase
MILIADSGSTKCDWLALENKKLSFKTSTEGLNPAVFDIETLEKRILSNTDLTAIYNEVQAIYFYGAGCGTKTPKRALEQLLSQLFPIAKITIKEDMYGAVYAVTNEPAIVCILGTGSNSCYFDGKNIHSTIPSLGYTIMDEASGNYIGKQLLRDYFYKEMPQAIAANFETQYHLNPDDIKLNLYKKDNPNTYLASFAHFVFSQDLAIPYFYNLVSRAFADFIKNHVLCYENATELPIHFIGSIAHYGKSILKESLKHHGLKLGEVIKKPIDGLIAHHLK